MEVTWNCWDWPSREAMSSGLDRHYISRSNDSQCLPALRDASGIADFTSKIWSFLKCNICFSSSPWMQSKLSIYSWDEMYLMILTTTKQVTAGILKYLLLSNPKSWNICSKSIKILFQPLKDFPPIEGLEAYNPGSVYLSLACFLWPLCPQYPALDLQWPCSKLYSCQ